MKYLILIFLVLTIGQSVIQYPTPEDLQVLDQLCYLSFASYCDSRNLIGLQEWNCGEMCETGPQLKNVSFCITESRNYAMMGYDHKTKTINVVFRGTISTSFTNWMTNLDYKMTTLGISECPGCQVHQGFFDSYKGLRNCMVSNFKKLKSYYHAAPVRITGHSLGGALATLGAVDLKVMAGLTPDYFVTYGQPKVGNLEFQKFFNQTVKPVKNFRVTHFRDPVPFLPMELQGFKHVGTNIAYNQDSTVYYVTETDYYKYGASIMDHLTYMGKYWDPLQASEQCNYPDKTVLPDPYRKSYANYQKNSNCVSDNKKQNGANAMGCTPEGCFIQKVNTQNVADTFFDGNCYQTMTATLSEAQSVKKCNSNDNISASYQDGSFCCKTEKQGGLLYSVNIQTVHKSIGYKNYCMITNISK